MHESTARKRKSRHQRKQAGMKAFELWLDADTAALLAQLKQPGESLQAVIRRALLALQAQATQESTSAVMERPERSERAERSQ
jgi:hypothetical protein